MSLRRSGDNGVSAALYFARAVCSDLNHNRRDEAVARFTELVGFSFNPAKRRLRLALGRNEVRTRDSLSALGDSSMKEFTTILLIRTLRGIVEYVHQAPDIDAAHLGSCRT